MEEKKKDGEVAKGIIKTGKNIGRIAHLIKVTDALWKITIEKGNHIMSAEKNRLYKREKEAKRQFKLLTGILV